MTVLEPYVPARAIVRFTDGPYKTELRTVQVLRVAAVVVERPQSDRRVIARSRWPSGLHCIAALRVALQIEALRDAHINVLGIPHRCGIVAAVRHRDRPRKIPVVRISADFNRPLRRSQHKGIVRRIAYSSRKSRVETIRSRADVHL